MQEHFHCQRGHGAHATKRVPVQLGGPTKYADLPAIPLRFARMFEFQIFDWEQYADGDGYCPGNDAVSQTIDQLGIWEPAETALMLSACTAHAGEWMVDFGAHIGWFSTIARSCGAHPLAIEGDLENIRLEQANTFGSALSFGVVGPGQPQLAPIIDNIGVCKVDVEGAEGWAIEQIRPLLAIGKVGHLLMEASPCFADYYGDLVVEIRNMGYDCWIVPDKRYPPVSLEDPQDGLGHPLSGDDEWLRDEVNSWHQKNLWFVGPNGRWA